MTTIDQRILIPVAPSVVWDYIKDITQNPDWQADCKSVTFLTSRRGGPGTRWRFSTDKGTERVAEITAWYEGLGYQYTFVDGVPFRQSTCRIRLQEIPEGTVVQWTISYEMGGLLGGMRGSLSVGRQIETAMEASLKTLWRQVNQSGAAREYREAKSLMRDAPDYEARAQYKPRHPAVVDVKGADENAPKAAPKTVEPAARIPEPPVAEDDTRPRPAVRPERTTIADLVEATEEPEFLDDLSRFAPPDYASDTQPIKPVTGVEIPEAPAEPAPEPAAAEDFDFGFDDWFDQPSPAAADKPEAPAKPAIDTAELAALEASFSPPPLSDETIVELPRAKPAQPAPAEAPPVEEAVAPQDERPGAPAEPEAATTETTPPVPASIPGEDVSIMDTATLSVFDVFGVPKPSDSERLRAVTEAELAAAALAQPDEDKIVVPDLPPAAPGSRRVGLRLTLRRRAVKLRWIH